VEDNLLHTSGSRRRLKCLLGHRNRPFSDSPHESSNCESLFRWLPLRRPSLKSTAAASSPCPSPSAPNRSSSLAASLLDSASSFPLTADTPAVSPLPWSPPAKRPRSPTRTARTLLRGRGCGAEGEPGEAAEEACDLRPRHQIGCERSRGGRRMGVHRGAGGRSVRRGEGVLRVGPESGNC
ncbi:hypothetical protein GW17_00050781, partial [Ensete ventricosum]